ncbi:hypothetical protein [Yersinia aldovae]|uniref:hypothetical protein n=1 Tax=Yersinia aldovae TaxID=29483 RepID=UPI0011A2722A|nr:hypothetical protein [Yersinia aldovae]
MILLSDNDVILKLAQCSLLHRIDEILNAPLHEILVSPTAKFQLMPKKTEKAIAKCGSTAIYEGIGIFLDRVGEIPVVQDFALVEKLGQTPNIDVGEQQLLAACVETPDMLFMTGDKRCLEAVNNNCVELNVVHHRLMNSVITFESSILLAVDAFGFNHVKPCLQQNPKPDGMLRIALRGDPQEDHVCDCMFSFTKSVYNYLAYKDRLPPLGTAQIVA